MLPSVAFVAGDPHLVGLVVLLGGAADAADYIIRTLVFVGGGGGFLGCGLGFGSAFLAGATGALLWCLNWLVKGVEVFVLAFGGACRAAGVCLLCRAKLVLVFCLGEWCISTAAGGSVDAPREGNVLCLPDMVSNVVVRSGITSIVLIDRVKRPGGVGSRCSDSQAAIDQASITGLQTRFTETEGAQIESLVLVYPLSLHSSSGTVVVVQDCCRRVCCYRVLLSRVVRVVLRYGRLSY